VKSAVKFLLVIIIAKVEVEQHVPQLSGLSTGRRRVEEGGMTKDMGVGETIRGIESGRALT